MATTAEIAEVIDLTRRKVEDELERLSEFRTVGGTPSTQTEKYVDLGEKVQAVTLDELVGVRVTLTVTPVTEDA